MLIMDKNKPAVADAPKKQVMRYSEAELGLIKATFAENDVLIKALRKMLLQLPTTDAENKIVTSAIPQKSEGMRLFKKTLHPDLDGDAPIFQVTDLWSNVEIKDKSSDVAIAYIYARDIMVGYFDTFFHNFSTGIVGGTSFKDLTKINYEESNEKIHAKILARNTILNHVEFQLNQLLVLAGVKEKDVAKQEENKKKNSNK